MPNALTTLLGRMFGKATPATGTGAKPATTKPSGKAKTSGSTGQQFLPPLTDPKVKPKQQSIPSYFTTATPNPDARIQKVDIAPATTDTVATYRSSASTPDAIRMFARTNPDLSAALSAYLHVGIPEKYFAIARNPDGTVNDDGCRIAFEIIQRMDKIGGTYDTGFSQVDSFRSVSESLAKEALIYGALACELVLDKSRMPFRFQPINAQSLFFYPDTSGGSVGLRPVQVIGGQEIDLDIPTFFMVWIDPDLRDAYPQSPFEAAVQAVLSSATFLNDLRRVMARHVYPRMVVTVDEEKFRLSVPPEIQADPDVELPKYINNMFSNLETTINNLGVEEALIIFDFITVSYIENDDGVGTSAKFDTVKGILDANLAKGAKVLPSVLGNSSDSQNIASTETMLFLLAANSKVRLKLQELYSKMLTLGVRLFGLDVVVEFEFDPIELRPVTELEAFKTLYTARLMDQWAKGLIGDMEASLRLTYRPVPPTFTTLSGTYFTTGGDPNGAPGAAPADLSNPTSGTGTGGGQSGGSAQQQSRKPATPSKKSGGQSK